jgi:uncharacterized protein YcsI (UPF0317 family)
MKHPPDVRMEYRTGQRHGVTSGLCPGYVQANLVMLPARDAQDFRAFCERNPRPCPLIEVTTPGTAEATATAPGSDLRTDLPLYRVYEHGELISEIADVSGYWSSDIVSFLIGCSFTFEWALLEAGVPLRHQENGRNVAMWRSSVQCEPAGAFAGPMVVSMRPIPTALVDVAVAATARFPRAHGAPVHVGDPGAIGIRNLDAPDWGDPQHFRDGDVPVFWACGVTPQAAAIASRVPFMITHSPGHMFVTDLPIASLEDEIA